MKSNSLVFCALIGAVASARSMTPMATIAAARFLHRRTPGQLVLLDRPLFRTGAIVMGIGEIFGDKMKTAPDRTVFLGLLARVMSAGIAGAALAPRGREQVVALTAVTTAIPLAYSSSWEIDSVRRATMRLLVVKRTCFDGSSATKSAPPSPSRPCRLLLRPR